ncbi:hypothetical protein C8R44DRAFT_747343 [Mycena epipterygia]|nr:hypothetical protein C8R44DRAFT_747343 [Mycena epipterygia]
MALARLGPSQPLRLSRASRSPPSSKPSFSRLAVLMPRPRPSSPKDYACCALLATDVRWTSSCAVHYPSLALPHSLHHPATSRSRYPTPNPTRSRTPHSHVTPTRWTKEGPAAPLASIFALLPSSYLLLCNPKTPIPPIYVPLRVRSYKLVRQPRKSLHNRVLQHRIGWLSLPPSRVCLRHEFRPRHTPIPKRTGLAIHIPNGKLKLRCAPRAGWIAATVINEPSKSRYPSFRAQAIPARRQLSATGVNRVREVKENNIATMVYEEPISLLAPLSGSTHQLHCFVMDVDSGTCAQQATPESKDHEQMSGTIPYLGNARMSDRFAAWDDSSLTLVPKYRKKVQVGIHLACMSMFKTVDFEDAAKSRILDTLENNLLNKMWDGRGGSQDQKLVTVVDAGGIDEKRMSNFEAACGCSHSEFKAGCTGTKNYRIHSTNARTFLDSEGLGDSGRILNLELRNTGYWTRTQLDVHVESEGSEKNSGEKCPRHRNGRQERVPSKIYTTVGGGDAYIFELKLRSMKRAQLASTQLEERNAVQTEIVDKNGLNTFEKYIQHGESSNKNQFDRASRRNWDTHMNLDVRLTAQDWIIANSYQYEGCVARHSDSTELKSTAE